MYLLSVTGLIACKDVRLYDASSCPLTSPTIFYKLREIERYGIALRNEVTRIRQQHHVIKTLAMPPGMGQALIGFRHGVLRG